MKTLFQTTAVLAGLIVPANAFEPIPFSLTFPTQPRVGESTNAHGAVSKLNLKDRSNVKVAPDNLEKYDRAQGRARTKKQSR